MRITTNPRIIKHHSNPQPLTHPIPDYLKQIRTNQKRSSSTSLTRTSSQAQTSGVGIIKGQVSLPAPRFQFMRYLNQAENVFYQDSREAKTLRIIKTLKYYLAIVLAFLVLLYIAVGRIVPYPPETCPRHATCSVFIHCHQGYTLRGNTCVIDPLVISHAQEIGEAVIAQLSLNLGNSECKTDLSKGSSIHVHEVLKEFQIEDGILRDELIYFLQSKERQNALGFSFRANNITALQKKYSFACSAELFVSSPHFKYYLFAIMMGILVVAKVGRQMWEKRKTVQIYNYLKGEVQRGSELCINSAKRQCERRFGMWSTSLWVKIDRERYKDGCISYYTEHDELFWKWLD